MLLGPIVDAPVEEWERMVAGQPRSASSTCAHAALPHLLDAAEDDPRRVADLVNISSVAGRDRPHGSGVYNATKHARRRLQRVAAPGGDRAPRARLAGRARRRRHRAARATTGPRSARSIEQRFGDIERLEADDIADAIAYVVTRPRHVAVNEVLIRPTEQEQ